MAYISQDKIFDLTNGGLDIIKSYYPDANEKKAFKIRDEKTPSTSMRKRNGVFLIKDFGDDSKPMSAISVVMSEENLEFKDALLYINKTFLNGQISGETLTQAKPIFENVEAPKDVIFEFNTKLSEIELKLLGPKVTQEIADKFNLKSIKFYINKKGHKRTSTPEFPILCFVRESFNKIYNPKAEKSKRFFHTGTRPSDYIYGLEELTADYQNKLEDNAEKLRMDNEKMEEEDIKKLAEENVQDELEDLIIGSGERDALNIASAGYNVVWQNSETATLSSDDYYKLKKYAKTIYNVPDIDKTGVKQGYKLALKYLDIKTIWLPETLKNWRDKRGNPCKDVTDFFTKYDNAEVIFKKMKAVAIPLKFWKQVYDKKKKINSFSLDNTSFYQFLIGNGFFRTEDKNNSYGYIYTKINNNIVTKIEPTGRNSVKNKVKDFVNSYLIKKYLPIELRNMFYKSRQTDENSLMNLPIENSYNFNSSGADFQYMFFKNKAWKITPSEIIEGNPKDIPVNIWEHDIKTKCERVHKTKLPIFEINYTDDYKQKKKTGSTKDISDFSELDKFDIKINDDKFIYFKYLINASRIFWRKETAGEELSELEIKEEKLHLINKIYSIGYLAHRYKKSSHAWAVFALDGKESEVGKSFGGSGKSICYMGLEHINEQFYIGGRDPNITKNSHIFDGIDEHTYNLLIDDADQYLKFDFFYPFITGKFNVNPKNNTPFTLKFNDSPKLVFTSNYPLRDMSPSTERRILYTVFSDYYHKKDTNGLYKETVSPNSEFGKDMFEDFTEEEWNLYYNFIALCMQTYMRFEKIEPPMVNVTRRNLRTGIGEDVLAWAGEYFSNPQHLDLELNKNDAFDSCKEYLPQSHIKFFSPRKFKDKIKLYCQYRSWNFNPEYACNTDDGRIMKKLDNKTVEYFYIQTDDNIRVP